MAGFDVSLERMLDASGQETWMAKLASDSFEVNVEAPLEDLLRLEGINSATWEAGRSLGVGTCLGHRSSGAQLARVTGTRRTC